MLTIKELAEKLGAVETLFDPSKESLDRAKQAIREKTAGYIINYNKKSMGEKQAAREDWLIRKGKVSGKERMIISDKEGKILGIAKGNENNVNFNKRIKKILATATEKSFDIAHNHPTGFSFSLEDLQVLNSNKAIRTLSAIGHNGKKYYISIPKGKETDRWTIRRYYDKMRTLSIEEADCLLKKGKLNIHHWGEFVSDKIVFFLAKEFDWNYRR